MKNTLSTYEKPLEEIRNSLDLNNKEKRIEELHMEMEAPGFWDDPQKSQKDSQLLGDLRNDVKGYSDLESKYTDMLDLIDMANDENDESMVDEIKNDYEAFRQRFDEMKTATLLSEKYDDANTVIRFATSWSTSETDLQAFDARPAAGYDADSRRTG